MSATLVPVEWSHSTLAVEAYSEGRRTALADVAAWHDEQAQALRELAAQYCAEGRHTRSDDRLEQAVLHEACALTIRAMA